MEDILEVYMQEEDIGKPQASAKEESPKQLIGEIRPPAGIT
jgi:hypothetical protein